MRKVYVSAIEFLRMCESGRLAWPFSHAIEFIKTCRQAGTKEWRIAEPERGQWLVVQIPEFPIWCDYYERMV